MVTIYARAKAIVCATVGVVARGHSKSDWKRSFRQGLETDLSRRWQLTSRTLERGLQSVERVRIARRLRWTPYRLLELGPIKAPFDHPDWLFERKFDGFRCLAFLEKGSVRARLPQRQDLQVVRAPRCRAAARDPG